jgi:hypothetical protein
MTIEETTAPDDESESQDPGAGSGEGGDRGTPTGLPEAEPPSTPEEANEAVSGGGMVQPEAEDDAKESPERD